MKAILSKTFALLITAFLFSNLSGQSQAYNFNGWSVFQNNEAISKLSGYSDGTPPVDTRYEGVKGSPMLYDGMVQSLIKVNFLDKYLSIKSNLDAYSNGIVFAHPSTGKLLLFPCNSVEQAVFIINGERQYIRTTKGLVFDHPIEKAKFCQVLYSNGTTVIRTLVKLLNKADYQGNYSPNKRYDEFVNLYTYYQAGSDQVFHKISANKKTLAALFPDKKAVIESVNDKSYDNKDDLIQAILTKISAMDSVRH